MAGAGPCCTYKPSGSREAAARCRLDPATDRATGLFAERSSSSRQVRPPASSLPGRLRIRAHSHLRSRSVLSRGSRLRSRRASKPRIRRMALGPHEDLSLTCFCKHSASPQTPAASSTSRSAVPRAGGSNAARRHPRHGLTPHAPRPGRDRSLRVAGEDGRAERRLGTLRSSGDRRSPRSERWPPRPRVVTGSDCPLQALVLHPLRAREALPGALDGDRAAAAAHHSPKRVSSRLLARPNLWTYEPNLRRLRVMRGRVPL